MGEEGGIGFPHATTHTPLLPTRLSHPLLPATPPATHSPPDSRRGNNLQPTSITFPRTTIFVSVLHLVWINDTKR